MRQGQSPVCGVDTHTDPRSTTTMIVFRGRSMCYACLVYQHDQQEPKSEKEGSHEKTIVVGLSYLVFFLCAQYALLQSRSRDLFVSAILLFPFTS